jgi:proteasome beta subunit
LIPFFPGQTYRGSSFLEFLQVDHPYLLPRFDKVDWTHLTIPHGTTVLSLVFEDGVLVAGDRLATEGNWVGTRDLEKVFTIDDTCVMAIAGAAGPAIEMVRMFQLELEHFEKVDGHELTFEGKANRLSFFMRQNLPAAMQGLIVMPLFAGYDRDKGRGRIYKFDVTGGRYNEADYYATGSGGKDARGTLKKIFRASGFSRHAAVEAAVEALLDAADEDTATGGFDLDRGILPTVKLVTKEGVEDASNDEILAAHKAVSARVQRT